jgi:hypothetical protein
MDHRGVWKIEDRHESRRSFQGIIGNHLIVTGNRAMTMNHYDSFIMKTINCIRQSSYCRLSQACVGTGLSQIITNHGGPTLIIKYSHDHHGEHD